LPSFFSLKNALKKKKATPFNAWVEKGSFFWCAHSFVFSQMFVWQHFDSWQHLLNLYAFCLGSNLFWFKKRNLGKNKRMNSERKKKLLFICL